MTAQLILCKHYGFLQSKTVYIKNKKAFGPQWTQQQTYVGSNQLIVPQRQHTQEMTWSIRSQQVWVVTF